MRIGGFQKTSLLDFPGKLSALIFTQGCNFFCPYCHNPQLVPSYGQEQEGDVALEAVLAFLRKRKKLLQGVVISGGEATLQPDLEDFCRALGQLGYAIKLDTNGSRPEVLRNLLEQDLLDYVALDVKGDPLLYPKELCSDPQGAAMALVQSMEALCASSVKYELRIPCAAPFVDAEFLQSVLALPRKQDSPVFLQELRLERVLRPDFFSGSGRALSAGEIRDLQILGERCGAHCLVRGAG